MGHRGRIDSPNFARMPNPSEIPANHATSDTGKWLSELRDNL